jgi:hypothetical protein
VEEVETSEVAQTVAHVKCLLLHALSVEKKQKYLSNQKTADPFIVESALTSVEQNSKVETNSKMLA